MNKVINLKKNTYIFFALLFWCLISVPEESFGDSSQNSDVASIKWENRVEVQEAVKNLREMHRLFENVVYEIYNAYVPYTIGTVEIMRDRMKALGRLINALKQFEKINVNYTQLVGSKRPFDIKMEEIKKVVHFHYFQSETRSFDCEGHTIISEVGFALSTLCEDPKFGEVTNIKIDQIENMKKALYAALHNAMQVIPGGITALQS
jgi:diphthamide synthase subunit DPH2